jgi:hypothetical protein
MLPKVLSLFSQDIDVKPGATTRISLPKTSHSRAQTLSVACEAESSLWTIKIRPDAAPEKDAEFVVLSGVSTVDKALLDLVVSLPSIALKLEEDDESSVMRLVLEVIEFKYGLTNSEHNATFVLRTLRAHNDLPHARHPALVSGGATLSHQASAIRFSRIARGAAAASSSQFLSIRIAKLTRLITRDLHYIPSASVAVQLVRLSVDEELVEAILAIFEKVLPPTSEEQQQNSMTPSQTVSAPELPPAQGVSAVYVESLKISPISVVVAFSPVDSRRQQSQSGASTTTRLVRGLKWASAILGAISESPIELSALSLDSVLLPGGFGALGTILKQHYVSQVISKILSLSRGSGTFGTTASFFTRVALRFGLANTIASKS